MSKTKPMVPAGSSGEPAEPVEPAENADSSRVSGELAFHYIKSNHFRVIYGDGAIGAPSPDGQSIHFAIYNERIPIPRVVVNILKDGKITGEVSKEARQGIVREVEVDVIMSIDDAETLSKWLATNVKKLRSLLAGKVGNAGGADDSQSA